MGTEQICRYICRYTCRYICRYIYIYMHIYTNIYVWRDICKWIFRYIFANISADLFCRCIYSYICRSILYPCAALSNLFDALNWHMVVNIYICIYERIWFVVEGGRQAQVFAREHRLGPSLGPNKGPSLGPMLGISLPNEAGHAGGRATRFVAANCT